MYSNRVQSCKAHELTHVTDEAAADQFIAAANAFRMQKMGMEAHVPLAHFDLDTTLAWQLLIWHRQGSWRGLRESSISPTAAIKRAG